MERPPRALASLTVLLSKTSHEEVEEELTLEQQALHAPTDDEDAQLLDDEPLEEDEIALDMVAAKENLPPAQQPVHGSARPLVAISAVQRAHMMDISLAVNDATAERYNGWVFTIEIVWGSQVAPRDASHFASFCVKESFVQTVQEVIMAKPHRDMPWWIILWINEMYVHYILIPLRISRCLPAAMW